jgi:DNA-binding transcriptional MerR regulator
VTAERSNEGAPRDDAVPKDDVAAPELAAVRPENTWPPVDELLSVDELAERSGMTVRNIRAHQSRRLLHPPRRVGRRSVYDNSHVERLMLIRRLQNGGFSLSAIRALVRAGNEAGELALAWRAEAVAMRFLPGDEFDDAKLEIEPDGMTALLAQPGALERLESFGIARRTPGGGWQGSHPVLVEAGRRAREMGLPSPEITRVQLEIAALAQAMAREMVSTFKKHFADGSRARVLEDYSVLSPIATAIVTATFEVQMARVVREQFGLTPEQLP